MMNNLPLKFACWLLFISCSKKSGSAANPEPPLNHAPVVSVSAVIKSLDPFTVHCTADAKDEDKDPLSYSWNSGNGDMQTTSTADFTYPAGKQVTVTLSVSDGRSAAVKISLPLNTTVQPITIDEAERHQQMQGFGGFGAKDVYWSAGPFTSPDFINDVINDLGLTILRDNIPTDFEQTNDDDDPNTTDLSKFRYGGFKDHIQYLKDLKAAGLQKLIITSWSPPAWMKTNKNVNGLKADAPAYQASPDASVNQLLPGMYDEFAERCVAYIKIVQQETGIDVYAISLQNEPRFTEPYESCVFNGEALRDLIRAVGRRFAKDGIQTKIFMPEDVGYFDGIRALVQPILSDAEAMGYVDIIATHGYAFDGVTAASTDAQTWNAMYQWGAGQGKPLWMTETSGFSNDMQGAIDLSKAMYTALTFGNVSAWVFWSISSGTLDAYSLMRSDGLKSKRYFTSKNMYHYVRPGAWRVSAGSGGDAKVYPLAFINDADHSETVVLVNDGESATPLTLSGLPDTGSFGLFLTDSLHDCMDMGGALLSPGLLIPPKSVVTLYRH